MAPLGSLRARPSLGGAAQNKPDWAADEDAVIALRACADPRALAPLSRRYVGPIYRTCHRRLGSREAAEDATSLDFAKVLATRPSRTALPAVACRHRPQPQLRQLWLLR